MKVLDLLNQPWAITPAKLEAMCDVYDRHTAGVGFDEEKFFAALGTDPRNASKAPPYTVQNGVAIIPVDGVLAKKMNMFTAFSGGMSTQMLTDAVNQAVADSGVHSLILSIDSPGGEVDGTQQIGDAVAASTKPTVAWVDGQACSAAYWIAVHCDQIFADSETAQVGSIGIVMTHTDRSKANEQRGVNPTSITTGKYKRILSPDAPLSQDGLAYAQSQLDYLHTLFVNDVAEGLDMDPETVASNIADGRTFFAQQAIDAGMIDGIASLDEIVAQLNADYQQQKLNPGAKASAKHPKGANTMADTTYTQAQLDERVTTATAAALEQGRTEGRATGLTEGATAERSRIQAVEAAALPGHGALINKLKFDGITTGDMAASAIVSAERALRVQAGVDLSAEAPKPAAPSTPSAVVEAAVQTEAEKAAAAAAAPKPVAAFDPGALAAKATAYVAEQAGKGRKIGLAEAMSELKDAAAAK